jgi:hypothetical protein
MPHTAKRPIPQGRIVLGSGACEGTTAIPAGPRRAPPDESIVCEPVTGSTRMMRLTPGGLGALSVRILPSASMAMPMGITRLPPDETTDCAPVLEFTRIILPKPFVTQ